ncbi:MAG: nicotinate-nucleotide adenylyltransferase [Bacteroidaceae bacterium]|nr:nicotinate-nucleotide adenylyltransferase [Bacteroidaceae bacterium]
MESKKRCGIFGGSFNPIHNGHIAIGSDLLQTGFVDEIWFVVSPQNPFKQQCDLWDDELRFDLTTKALADHQRMKACDVEMHLPKPSYMWVTLEELSARHTEYQFVLLIGADNWQRFGRWYRSEDILSNYEIGIYPRPGYDIDGNTLPENVHYLTTGLYDISSTEIRERLKKSQSVKGLVPPSIEKLLEKLNNIIMND